MPSYQHNVSGFFTQRGPAEATLNHLLQHGLRPEQVQIIAAASIAPPHEHQRTQAIALQRMLNDGLLGTALGSGIGIVLQIGLIISGISLFSASSLLSPMLLIGWGAFVGGFLGCLIGVVGAAACTGNLAHRGRAPMALYAGDVVLLAHTCNARETALTRSAIQASAGLCRDTRIAGNHFC